jgi:hypothetical protein
MTELPIKSKFLIFEFHPKTQEVFVYNKKHDVLVAYIYKPKGSLSYVWKMESGTIFDSRSTEDILKALEHLRGLK